MSIRCKLPLRFVSFIYVHLYFQVQNRLNVLTVSKGSVHLDTEKTTLHHTSEQ